MTKPLYRFTFDPSVSLAEADALLTMSVVAAEAIHGPARLRLDARYWMDRTRRVIVIDGSGHLGGSLAQIFANHLRHEFGEDAFQVRRIDRHRGSTRRAAHGAGTT